MPDLPTDPTALMRDLIRLNQWLTRIIGAYAFATDTEKQGIDVQIRALLDGDEDLGHVLVNRRGDSVGIHPSHPIWFAFPCEHYFTSVLDLIFDDIEGRLNALPE